MKDKLEVEAKWSSRSESGFAAFRTEAVRSGARLGRSRFVLIKDSYLDTPDACFGRRRVSCRLRNAGGRWELTLKGRTALKAGVARRRERTYPLGRPRSLPEAMRKAACVLAGVPGADRLENLFFIRNRRSVFVLALKGGASAEASFDRVVMSRGKRKVRMLEIELEFLKGSRRAFAAFVRSLARDPHFFPAVRSKVATALAAFRLEPRSSRPRR